MEAFILRLILSRYWGKVLLSTPLNGLMIVRFWTLVGGSRNHHYMGLVNCILQSFWVFFPPGSGSSLYLKLYLKSAHQVCTDQYLTENLRGTLQISKVLFLFGSALSAYASLQCLSHLLPQISSSISLIQAWVLPLHMSWKASPGRELEQL